MNPKDIRISDFDYELKKDQIALFPKQERDQSKLLVYKSGLISHGIFTDIKDILTDQFILVKNQTRVIPARIWFKKPNGSIIEIFCLSPVSGSQQDAMHKQENTEWNCLVGNNKKWKEGEILELISSSQGDFILLAERIEKNNDTFIVRFSWRPQQLTFSQVLEIAGQVPLPPYFHREVVPEDKLRYQTVFAKTDGSVAAPTAGLHFTDSLLNELTAKGIGQLNVTLHVGAGTFRPVSSETISGHDMHSEEFSVQRDVIEYLLLNRTKKVIPVGTTSMRTLESIYWLGVLLNEYSGEKTTKLHVPQWIPYENKLENTTEKSLQNILRYLDHNHLKSLDATSAIIIAPGYKFRICNGLITNFHMPKSTLLLLVSAMIGDDWKRVYDYAATNDFKFLSYGDSSILLPEMT